MKGDRAGSVQGPLGLGRETRSLGGSGREENKASWGAVFIIRATGEGSWGPGGAGLGISIRKTRKSDGLAPTPHPVPSGQLQAVLSPLVSGMR